MIKIKYLLMLALALVVVSCSDDDDDDTGVDLPSTYNFDNASYSGQTERIEMLSQMTSLAKSSLSGSVEAGALAVMYSNEGGNGGGNFDFTSTKDLKSKTAAAGLDVIMTTLTDIEALYQYGSTEATFENNQGTAGFIMNGSSKYLIDENGYEPIQMLDKGMMGAVFLDQICNVYLQSGKMDVDNENLEEGKNYTEMEHHWDEAFGYFGAPVNYLDDLSAGKYWAKYATRLSSGATGGMYDAPSTIFNAYIKGRQAIIDKDYSTRDAQIEIIYKELEMVTAATAINYINSSINDFSNDGGRIHWLSEAYAFIWNIKFGRTLETKVNNSKVDEWLALLGKDYWNISVETLEQLRDEISSAYGFDNFKSDL